LDFMMLLQQLALADVLQIHPDEIHILPPDTSLERLFLVAFFFVRLTCRQRFEVVTATDGLVGKRLRLVLFEELARFDGEWLTFLRLLALFDREAVILSAVV